jgi:hypothetical protein
VKAVWDIIYDNPSTTFNIFIPSYTETAVERWRRDILHAIAPTYTRESQLQQVSHIKYVTQPVYSSSIADPHQFIQYAPSPKYMAMAEHIKRSIGVHEESVGRQVTFVFRTSSRVVYDTKTHQLVQDILSVRLKELDIPYESVCFDDIDFADQVRVMAKTKVLVCVHGAALTNLIFLPSHGHVMEINFRKHWYCDPVCDDHFAGTLASTCKCNGALTFRPYFHKADYHNLARLFDKNHKECTIDRVEEYIDRNPINVRRIFVDTEHLLEDVKSLW